MKDLEPFPGTQEPKSSENVELSEYEDLVKDAKSSDPKTNLPKLPLPEEFVDVVKTIDEQNTVDAVDSSEENVDLSLNKQLNDKRSGRISNFPSRYTYKYYNSFK